MSKPKVYLVIGIVMLVVMILFAAYALQHPEGSFAGGNKVAYAVYIIYLIVIVVMFILFRAAVKK